MPVSYIDIIIFSKVNFIYKLLFMHDFMVMRLFKNKYLLKCILYRLSSIILQYSFIFKNI